MSIQVSCTCGRVFSIDEKHAGRQSICPDCGHRLTVTGSSTEAEPPQPTGDLCAICQCTLESADDAAACPDCGARYHADCWEQNQGCAVYGCAQVPPTEGRSSLEIPVSYWGQEEKPCPVCHETILAAAVRCRFCGATFESARPESTAEFRSRIDRKQRLAGMGAAVTWFFIFALVPCTAPLAALVGAGWYVSQRSDFRALRGLHAGFFWLGLCIAWGQTLMVFGFSWLYALYR